MIQSIPKFECSDGSPLRFEDEFFENKLMNALTNQNIICVARGEGRSRFLNDIIFHPEILFDWGEKSIHALLDKQDEKMRTFCDPEIVDKEVMIYYIRKYGQKLNLYYGQYKYLGCQEGDANDFVEQLINNVEVEDDVSKLLCIKEWLIYALHTMQEKEFREQ